ncbi:MAG TPA: hypothetical protein VJN43_06335, partial [Bryobacteraceae bacterium]|nr:hypothetical protein [Bryobacteraceae bacterium]
IVDFNGDLRSAERLADSSIEISYESSARALALIDRKPSRLELDGAGANLDVLASGPNFSVLLPRGQHFVTIHMN